MASAKVNLIIPFRMGVQDASLTVLWKKQTQIRNPPSSVFRMPYQQGFLILSF